MHDAKPSRVREGGPARARPSERPDNGAKSCRGTGPNSDVEKDNAHKRVLLSRHA